MFGGIESGWGRYSAGRRRRGCSGACAHHQSPDLNHTRQEIASGTRNVRSQIFCVFLCLWQVFGVIRFFFDFCGQGLCLMWLVLVSVRESRCCVRYLGEFRGTRFGYFIGFSYLALVHANRFVVGVIVSMRPMMAFRPRRWRVVGRPVAAPRTRRSGVIVAVINRRSILKQGSTIEATQRIMLFT